MSLHQPGFFPYIGVWDKFFCSDVFVWADDYQLVWNEYQRRSQVVGPLGEPRWLTVEVKREKQTQKICDTRVVSTKEVQQLVKAWYGKTDWGGRIVSFLEGRKEDTLSSLDLSAKQLLSDTAFIDIRKPTIETVTSLEPLEGGLDAQGKILKLCQKYGCDAYLSGPYGREYLDANVFTSHGVCLLFYDPQYVKYEQKYSPKTFIAGMSVIDMLVNGEKFDEIYMWKIRQLRDKYQSQFLSWHSSVNPL